MNYPLRFSLANCVLGLLVLACLGAGLLPSQAAPTIVSTVPPSSATAPMVFTFSEAMNTPATTVIFVDQTTYAMLTPSSAWSAGGTVLTWTPVSAWPAGHTVAWYAAGSSAGGIDMDTTNGTFTVSGSSSTGCDPNAPMLSLTVARGWTYDQSSASPPTIDPVMPYCFVGCTSIPCPRNATNVTLRAPGGSPANMPLTPIPGHLNLTDCRSTSAALDAAYPTGDYLFTIQAVSSNQQVTVSFPSTLTQPPVPRVSNYAAAQAVNPGQPFTLIWDAWPTPPTNTCVYVELAYGGIVFNTPALTAPGALPGTATSVVIPEMTLDPNRQYSGLLTFYHYLWLTNGTAYGALTYRATTTQFTLSTSAYCPVITNAGWAGAGTFRFDVTCPVSQPLVAECRTNLGLGEWERLCTTNSTTERVRFTDPAAGARGRSFYRVRTGS
jgi:hypothetical protein